jgi:NAD(P)-dependent dehydrogenase (short-subunit alcohol dehydrogenase family)
MDTSMALTERKRWFRGSLRDKVVVVTGASAGVGRATALAFARKGATVVLVARGADGLENALAEMRPLKVEALALPADVAEANQLEAVADQVHATYGRIDVWVNCAMASVFSPFVQMTTAEFRRATEVTYLGTVWGTRAALKYMRPAGRGTVVQVGSALAHRGIPLQSAYCGAKHAMVGFTESLRSELLHEKSAVRVCMVHLPAMNTPQFDWVKSNLTHRAQPVPPIFQPEVAARAIVWAAAHKRRALWVGGSTIVAIMGNWVAPGIGDRYLAITGFGSQQTKELERARPDNLWSSVSGLHRTRGRFDRRASSHSPLLWMSLHRRSLAGAALLGLAVLALRRRAST